MSENVYTSGTGHRVIIDGGDPLPGCPESWDSAREWADNVNNESFEYECPQWSWDCGFKLDYDGPLVSVSSRFYPPKSHYGPTWDGTVDISVLGKVVAERRFDCKTLEELHEQVTAFVMGFAASLQRLLASAEELNRIGHLLPTTDESK